MQDKMQIHPVIGPAISATSWVSTPVVGATTMFYITVARARVPVTNAVVTVTVKNNKGEVRLATTNVPPTGLIPGSYSVIPSSRTIFNSADTLYKAEWMITIPAVGSTPELVLPVVTQDMIAKSP
jgi:hypothetical protein